ncbi:DUF4231 domain-containing protein [Frondihabitans australicus]|uniref:Uncharacterized protein DUF4231 n=1 Tax=Frondihabitans australicus TaxID=386892 RepID=A0A495IEY9_9MICO|nr:DUF4231 domain-containing protein [Frondihabitans australicus]RKR74058.1 uncharacterized protein DUF4231 [Frondihabitans australicus]
MSDAPDAVVPSSTPTRADSVGATPPRTRGRRGQITPPPTEPPAPVQAPPEPAPIPDGAVDFVMGRMTYLLGWYEQHAQISRWCYLGIKVVQLIVAAAVSATALMQTAGPVLTAVLGGIILVLEGVQQAFQFHDNWIRYRSTHTTLLKTLTQWEVRAKPFDGADAVRQLALTLETLAGNETSTWAKSAEAPSGAGSGTPPTKK